MNEVILMLISPYLELNKLLNLLNLLNTQNNNNYSIIHNNLAVNYLKNLFICSNECDIIGCNILLKEKKISIIVEDKKFYSPNIYIHSPKNMPGLGITTLCFPLEKKKTHKINIIPINKNKYKYIYQLDNHIYFNFEPYINFYNSKAINLYSMCKFKKKINKIIF